MSQLLKVLCAASVGQEWQVAHRLGSVHCKAVAVQVTLDSFAVFPR